MPSSPRHFGAAPPSDNGEGLSHLKSFEAQSHSFSTRCLRFVPPSLATTQNSLPVVANLFRVGFQLPTEFLRTVSASRLSPPLSFSWRDVGSFVEKASAFRSESTKLPTKLPTKTAPIFFAPGAHEPRIQQECAEETEWAACPSLFPPLSPVGEVHGQGFGTGPRLRIRHAQITARETWRGVRVNEVGRRGEGRADVRPVY